MEFVEAINDGDADRLAELMADNHQLYVFGEPPLSGREANVAGWRQYLKAFPDYRIHPDRVVGYGARVAVLGHTTGSHLDLSDDEESELTLIWAAEVADNKLLSWRLLEDTPDWRRELGLDR